MNIQNIKFNDDNTIDIESIPEKYKKLRKDEGIIEVSETDKIRFIIETLQEMENRINKIEEQLNEIRQGRT